MIEINLLPEELRAKAAAQEREVSLKRLLYFIPALFGLFLFIHVFLAGIAIFKHCQLLGLNKKWNSLAVQRKALEVLRVEFTAFSADSQEMQQLASKRINWSEKLNKLSLLLPYGVWLNEISFAGNDFSIKASVISLKKEEMILINKFISSLKKDTRFFAGLTKLELVSVQRRQIAGYEVEDFSLTGALRTQ